MADDLGALDFEAVVQELRDLRVSGVSEIRRLQPHALAEAARRAGLVTTEDAVPAAIEELLFQAVQIFGDSGTDRDVAEYTFGLVPDYRLRSASARRLRAAEIYGITADAFRKEPERRVITQMAEAVLAVARSASTPGPEQVDGPAKAVDHNLRAVTALDGMSRQLAADLDVVTIGDGGESRTVRLSDGLYVEREQEQKLLDGLRGEERRHVLVSGDAGHGKSSLLWSLYTKLRHLEGYSPLLVSAAWFLDEPGGGQLVGVDQVMSSVAVAQSSGALPVVLLDTADLLLHQEAERQRVLELHRGLQDLDLPLILTVRPREAEALAGADFTRIHLPPYSDAEVDRAVEALTKTYSPDSAATAAVATVRSAVARGLPLREVVGSPLTLRMWFENASPQMPSIEADVTSIYRSYWQSKVQDDRRHLGQASTATDHSRAAGLLGITMLGLGSPELAVDVAARHLTSIHTERVEPDRALDELAHRGVLVRQRGRIRFFHQTLFEFAAAQGLLRRDPSSTIAVLKQRMIDQPDDLFVAAVVEQYLILAAADPIAAGAVSDCLGSFLGGEHPFLKDLALVVWAHHPELDLSPEWFAQVPASALHRFTMVAPAVAHLDADVLVDRLAVIWARNDRTTRLDVLRLLSRLAPQYPEPVARAMRQFECVEYFTRQPGTPLTGIPEILEQIAPVAPHYVRQQTVAILTTAIAATKSRDTSIALLGVLARTWHVVGSPDLLEQVTALIVAGQDNGDRDSREVREALGELLATAWAAARSLDEADWVQLVEAVARDTEADDESPRAGGGVYALVHLMSRMPAGDKRIGVALDRLWALQPPKAPWQPTRGAFADLLVTGSPAAHDLAARIVSALAYLPASANSPSPGLELRAALARQTLDNPRIPHELVAELLAERDYPAALWADDEGLLVLCAAAAAGGLPAAHKAIVSPLLPYAEWPERAARILHGRLQPLVPRVPEFLPAFLAVAQRLDETAGLRAYANEGQLGDALCDNQETLIAFVMRLLGGQPLQQRAGANLALDLERAGIPLWDAEGLRVRYEAATDAWARAALLELRTERALRDPASGPDVIAACRDLVQVLLEPPGLMAANHRNVPTVLIEAARTAWLHLLAATASDPADARQVVALAFAPLVNVKRKQYREQDLEAIDISFVSEVARAAVRFAERGDPQTAVQLVIAVERSIGGAGAEHANQSRKAANRMRGAFRGIIRHGSTDDVETLIRLVYGPQPAWGKLIVTTLALEGLARFRERLLALLCDPELPAGVASQIHLELKSRARVAGAGQFPEVIQMAAMAAPGLRTPI